MTNSLIYIQYICFNDVPYMRLSDLGIIEFHAFFRFQYYSEVSAFRVFLLFSWARNTVDTCVIVIAALSKAMYFWIACTTSCLYIFLSRGYKPLFPEQLTVSKSGELTDFFNWEGINARSTDHCPRNKHSWRKIIVVNRFVFYEVKNPTAFDTSPIFDIGAVLTALRMRLYVYMYI